jgi:energy-coupling factor transporter ATP-binding protein EcfA2
MTVTALSVKDFTAFSETSLDFSPGLNVLIGANAVGKTHLMKLIYTVLKTTEAASVDGAIGWEQLGLKLGLKLSGVFKPDGDRVGRLVKRARGRKHAEVTLRCGSDETHETIFRFTTLDKIEVKQWSVPTTTSCVFLPAHEVLSIYPNLIPAYQSRELSFDETIYDLCVALSAAPLRGPRLNQANELLKPLEKAVLRRVVMKGGRFYLQSQGEGMLEAPLVAEGLRKLGQLMHLIANGSLARAGVLFWDEPETNLNPKLTTTVARMLLALAGAGVQIFVTTHDYLLTNELSVAAEYGTPAGRAAKPRFFCLSRPKPRRPIQVQYGDTIADIEENPILQEFAAHYDRQQQLFNQSKSSKG